MNLNESGQNTSVRNGPERKRILVALTFIRTALIKDVPEIFSGTVEVDETYPGGQWKNNRKTIRDHGTKRGRGAEKIAVPGILCRNNSAWAEVVDDVGVETLQPLIARKVSTCSIVCPDTPNAYTGIASGDTFIVLSITVKNSTAMEKEIMSMAWKDS